MVSPILIPIIFVSSIPIIAIGYPLARAYAARLERKPMGPSVPPDVAARLERMEQAIDAIAVEVERISEGQRFTTKLLSERQASEALPSPPGSR
jgi:hypothetical protein